MNACHIALRKYPIKKLHTAVKYHIPHSVFAVPLYWKIAIEMTELTVGKATVRAVPALRGQKN